ncbi:MAG: thioredoxin family protein [Candidatus Gastranaerophilales bacterium]|nr:thioredoxin family protein [Candidatus Gastranaerophilales bacterium]
MKNIITIILILIIPIFVYLIMSKNSNDLNAIAKDNSNPTLIAFTSTMCMDCQKMKTVIKEIEKDYESKVNFVSVNALDKNRKVQDSIKKYGIVLVPTIILLNKNDVQVNKIEGYVPKEELTAKLEVLIDG